MKASLRQVAIAAAMLLILSASALTVWRFEQTLANGQTVILKLAPVDPRSVMQGDYMALAFAIDRELPDDAGQYRYAWLTVTETGVGGLHSLSNTLPQQDEVIALLLRQRDGIVSVGPNAFFFTEGSAAVYEAARYGQFKVDSSGKALLSSLLDENLQLLGENLR